MGSVWEVVRYPVAGLPRDVPHWTAVKVPHCYNARDAVDPDVDYYEGPAWYRTFLDPSVAEHAGRVLLHFEGTGQEAKVYVFTTFAGEHVGGYDEWTVDITDLVRKFRNDPYLRKYYHGKIPLAVRTDNTRNVNRIPSDLSDFNLYGGLYREVHLLLVPEVYLEGVWVTPVLGEDLRKGTLQVKVRLNRGLRDKGKVKVRIMDPEDRDVVSWEKNLTGKELLFSGTFKRPALWSPEHPALYRCEIDLVTPFGRDTLFAHFGFRNFRFQEKGPFYLNGRRLLIKGMSRHEDHAGVGAAMTNAQITREMIMMKEMGANFVRLAHYQQSSRVLDLCDSLGIMVWEEIPWCRGGLGGDAYRQQARRMLTNMIRQHYNHPAVIIWGLGNENDWPGDFPDFNRDSIRAFMRELNGLAHRLDSTRVTGIRRCDFCRDIVDVYSPSIWAGWYRGRFTEYRQASLQEFRQVDHFIHMEWGASSHARRHSEDPDRGLEKIPTGVGVDERAGDASFYGGIARASRDGDWTETYACNLIDWTLKEQETMGWLTGAAYWIFKDFSTPLRPHNPIPYVNQKGVVERDLTPKESYYVFQSYWTKKPMVHIYGHTWPVRWGKAGEPKLIKVYSNCPEAEVFLNGKSLGKKKRNSRDFPAAGLRWTTPFDPGWNEVVARARKGKELVTDTVRFFYETRPWQEPLLVRALQQPHSDGSVGVEITVRDRNGVICLDAKNWVRFEYVGTGKMLDDLGTYGGSRKIQLANGRAEMTVDPEGGVGILYVKVEDLEPLFVKIGKAKIQTDTLTHPQY